MELLAAHPCSNFVSFRSSTILLEYLGSVLRDLCSQKPLDLRVIVAQSAFTIIPNVFAPSARPFSEPA